ncbi:hypothetical protein D3C87_1501930 [compost metagenome]
MFGNYQRRVIGQHNPAATHTDCIGAAGNVADQHRGGRAGDAFHIVVFGKPIPSITKFFRAPREPETIPECGGCIISLSDRCKVKNRKWYMLNKFVCHIN